jgi:thiamine pyrophosphokinase
VDHRPQDRELALIVAAGDAPAPAPSLGPVHYVVAADGGLRHAVSMGLSPDVVIGDMDSVDADALARAADSGAALERHARAKDASDWELALRHVYDRGFRRVAIVGGAGGRLDHLLSNALVLAHADFAGLDVTWHVGEQEVRLARPGVDVVVDGAPGDVVSLLAVGGVAAGVTTTGLRWELAAADLVPGSSIGLSNELSEAGATVAVSAGTVLVIRPGGLR